GLDDEPGERGGLRPGLVEREEHDEAVDVGDGRVDDLGPPLEDVLDHAAAVGPVDGPDEDAVPDEDAAADLLEQRADDAEQVGATVVLQAGGAASTMTRMKLAPPPTRHGAEKEGAERK